MEQPQHGNDLSNGLSREQFERVRSMLESARKRTRPRKHDLYDVFCAVLYFLESGVAWRSMPQHFPPWRTVHEYFTQWSEAGKDETSLLEKALTETGRMQALERLRMLASPR